MRRSIRWRWLAPGVFAAGAVAAIVVAAAAPVAGTAQAHGKVAASDRVHPADAGMRDGSRDFDFKLGLWRTHIVRQVDPLSGSGRTIELHGTVDFRKVWGGRAFIEEIEADGPNGHWQGLTLFLYDPKAHTWSQNFANSRQGVLQPPVIGSFRDGRGELFAQDRVDGRPILLRVVWSRIEADTHQYEEFYSTDGGRHWLLAFRANLERIEQ